MQLKVTLDRTQGRSSDLTVTVDATALVSDVARALYSADPARVGATPPDGLTLRVALNRNDGGAVLDPTRNLIEAGLRSGAWVSLDRTANAQQLASGTGPAAALLRIVDGPDRGKEFSLPVGVTIVGRSRQADIVFNDPLASKKHARIVIGDNIEVVDLNSVNGVLVGGRRVPRAIVGSADVVLIGDTAVMITATRMAGTAQPTSSVLEFNRSPRVVPRFADREFESPELPKFPQHQRFPWMSLLMPLIMGAALFAFTRSLISLVFVGLMPLMMIGMWVDQILEGKRTLKRQKAQFATEIAALDAEIRGVQDVERAVRAARTPSTEETLTAIHRLGPLLWTRRPEHDTFLTLRLGVGAAPSHCSLQVTDHKGALPEYKAQITAMKRTIETIAPVPHIGDLRTAGIVGVAGPRGVVEGVARAYVLQLIGLHSPADLTLAVLASPSSRATWEWVQWLPHVGSVYCPIQRSLLADNQGTGAAVLSALEDLVAARQTSSEKSPGRGDLEGAGGATVPAKHQAPPLPAVVVVVEDDTPVDRSRLTRLAELGPDVGVHLLWIAAQEQALPAACRSFVVLNGDQGATVGQVRHGLSSYAVECARVDAETARRAALFLSPVVDVGVVAEDSTDLPIGVSWLDLVGLDVSEAPAAVLERWREGGSIIDRVGPPVARRKEGDLRALVGSAGATPLVLDLREHGPHALVGGTTGSGKSEFLQTWVLAMAAAHSPDRVTFLFVDYKGGAAFSDCTALPHNVGLVTDLSPYLVRRALTSLRAEIRYREHLLQDKRQKDLVSLERTGDPDCPPSLIIVVDEFAALVKEIPEFVDGVVDVAQRGRSLGLHLILATQRPAGVIKDNLRANTNLRIALRMADTDDSTDVLGTPDAAHFPTNVPGRAAAKTGPGRMTTFQTGYVGGWTTRTPEAPPIQIEEMRFGTHAPWEVPAKVQAAGGNRGPSDIARVVATIGTAATEASIPLPRKPWLPELSAAYNYRDLILDERTDDALLLGVGDDPAAQQQPLRYWEPNGGNMVIFGASGSGKSATLRQVAIAAAASSSLGPVHCYGIDFGSAGLSPIANLPNVGAVIDGDDEERLARLLRRMVSLVEKRGIRYAAANATTISQYRHNTGLTDEPRIILLVDGVGAFRETYELTSLSNLFTLFAQIAADGRGVGVHVVVTADRPSALPASLGSSIQRRVVLRMAADEDYGMLGIAGDILHAGSPPGRGVLAGCEVQIAVLGGDANLAVQAREIALFVEAMQRGGLSQAPGVESLPDSFELTSLPATVQSRDEVRPSFGLRHDTLEPIGIPNEGTVLVAGPPASGRSTALLTLALASRRANSMRSRVLLALKPSRLASNSVWNSFAVGAEAVADLARRLTDDIRGDVTVPGSMALFIEDLPLFNSTAAESPVVDLVKAAIDAGHLVVGEGEMSAWSGAWSLAPPFKAGRRGILLTPGDMDGDVLLSTPTGRVRRADLIPGRGYYIERGVATKMHVAQP